MECDSYYRRRNGSQVSFDLSAPLGHIPGMLREAERQLKSSLMDQDMVVTYLELVKVVRGSEILQRLTLFNIDAFDKTQTREILKKTFKNVAFEIHLSSDLIRSKYCPRVCATYLRRFLS